ncbi:MAG: hypothetical protein ACUVRD_03645 [Bacteroidia bacterium]
MKAIALSLVGAWLWAATENVGPDKLSHMILKVEPAQVTKAKELLTSLKGVKKVSFDEKTAELHVKYDKTKLGCCSTIYSTLEQNAIDYKLVSNKEYPACKEDREEKEGGKKTTHGGCAGKSSI